MKLMTTSAAGVDGLAVDLADTVAGGYILGRLLRSRPCLVL